MKTLTRLHISSAICLVAAVIGLVSWTMVSAQDSKEDPKKETPAPVTDDTAQPTPAPVAPRNTVRLEVPVALPPTVPATAVYEQPATVQAPPGFLEVVPIVDPNTGRTQYVARD